jgi:hypothetical protein
VAVKNADPRAVELDNAFSAAMKGPARPREAARPPEPVDDDAPHGRDEAGEPLAPFGYRDDGSVRKTSAGRPSKHAKARTAAAPPGQAPRSSRSSRKPAAAPAEPVDYAKTLGELHDALWMGLSGLSMVGSKLPVIGPKLSTDVLAAEAYIWRQNRDRIVKAGQITAEHNTAAAAQLARLATGNATWVLMVGFTLMPFVAQTGAVFSGDVSGFGQVLDHTASGDEYYRPVTVADLAGLNGKEMSDAMEQLRARAQEMAREADAYDAQHTNGQAPE